MLFLFFFSHPAPPEIYTLSLHDALPIYGQTHLSLRRSPAFGEDECDGADARGLPGEGLLHRGADRKSTRLNSSHTVISYAVFCLKKKKKKIRRRIRRKFGKKTRHMTDQS